MKGIIFVVALNHRGQPDAWHEAFQQAPYEIPPKTAVWFVKPRSTVIGDDETVPYPQGETVQSGATLALTVDKTTRKVAAAEATNYIAGYALANDMSLSEESFYRPAIKARCRDGSCPVGALSTVRNVDNLTIITEVNDREANSWRTGELQRNTTQLLSALSEFATLNPGDTILVGTPHSRVTLRPGDHVCTLADGFPVLEDSVVAEGELT